MTKSNFVTNFSVKQSPKEVFNAINNVRGWWSEEIDGLTDVVGAVFYYHYKDIHRCTIKIEEFIPNEKVVWRVLDNYFDFTNDKTGWRDTKISFEIAGKNSQTQLMFTHIGLTEGYECFEICSDAWSNYITNSLRDLIETGKGKPNPYAPAVESASSLKENNNG